ncbi:GntR family transcriptional regulator [Neobacillus sp. PS3-12]|jgi:GntR family transcriptional regulator, rspAB operon transcriptional repressor|uniref:GntR family transcriptional regulator n=1 Tax=Neobacillus sp. PS3-12 TaxID=3070677 RepID=UPI0027E1E21C|nr:GntR family transcriptional regulator [Neobacillus sp. PS3-12]WML54484.1 GntR family transcriptional regulator [Neobacillus sp. PS3-12]
MLTVSARLPGENNKDYSYRVVKEAIMSLELQPGKSLSEIELAEALNLSRTPIREVMAKLREEHLVEVFPQVGTYISKIKPQLVEEASFMRFYLEKEVLKLACESFPYENLLELKKNVALQKELIGHKGVEQEFHKLDTNFHHIIYQGNKKENVWAAITRLSTHYNRVRLLSEIEQSFERAIAQHERFIQIIENKEVQKVDEVVKEHILDPIKTWEVLYSDDSPYLDYFEKMPAFLLK